MTSPANLSPESYPCPICGHHAICDGERCPRCRFCQATVALCRDEAEKHRFVRDRIIRQAMQGASKTLLVVVLANPAEVSSFGDALVAKGVLSRGEIAAVFVGRNENLQMLAWGHVRLLLVQEEAQVSGLDRSAIENGVEILVMNPFSLTRRGVSGLSGLPAIVIHLIEINTALQKGFLDEATLREHRQDAERSGHKLMKVRVGELKDQPLAARDSTGVVSMKVKNPSYQAKTPKHFYCPHCFQKVAKDRFCWEQGEKYASDAAAREQLREQAARAAAVRISLLGESPCPSCKKKVDNTSIILGEYDSAPSACFVVTATYGKHSRQAVLVHARCRQRFLLNPLLILGWCLYKYYGPILAQWSQSSRIGFAVCKVLIADVIVSAAGTNLFVCGLCMLYLTLLSLLGLLMLVPFVLVRLLVQPLVRATPN